MNKKLIFTVLVLAFFLNLSMTNATDRVALVIGNGSYKSAPLKNPVNDARDMATVLKKSGFIVTLKMNATKKEMENSVREFGRTLRKGGVGLFYYAGHGMQLKGRNYLIPINALIESESDVEYESLDAGRVLGKMEDAGNDMNIVIFDACRNNPFARSFRSSTPGLARMDAPTGSLIAYATAPGNLAADGDGRNGVYTKHLIRNMKKSGLTIEQVFKNVRVAVLSETGNKQTPWEASSLTGNFYFTTGQIIAAVHTKTSETPYNAKLEKEKTEFVKKQQELKKLKLEFEKKKLDEEIYQSRSGVLFEEHFNDNNKGWKISDNDHVNMKISDGYLIMKYKKCIDNSWQSWIPINLKEVEGFRIESTMIKKRGWSTNYGFGLLLGRKDNKNRSVFFISHKGYWRYRYKKFGKLEFDSEWQFHGKINQSSANKLSIEKIGDRIKLYINDNFIKEFDYKKFAGDQFGFLVNSCQTVAFDNIIVTKLY